MPAAGQTWVDFNDSFFDQILNSVGVKELTRQAANRVLAEAKASAPVGDPSDPVYKRPERRPGQYRDGLCIEEVRRAHRTTMMVVGHDAKTMLVESQTGNLRKALKKARS